MNVIQIHISGAAGIGKSMLGCALAKGLLEMGHAVEVIDDADSSPTQLGDASLTATGQNYLDYKGPRSPVKIVISVKP